MMNEPIIASGSGRVKQYYLDHTSALRLAFSYALCDFMRRTVVQRIQCFIL
jgi:hypothetical protein